MIGNLQALMQRELWEHRSIFVTPVAIAVVLSLLTVLALVSAAAFGSHVDLAVLTASNIGELEKRAALMGFLSMPTMVFAIGAWILIVFYSLDTLYAERKNKSILFWRSLPLTETETVLSKLITALFVIPVVSLAIAAITHIVLLILASFWIMSVGADAGHLIWSSVPLFDVWLGTFIVAIAMVLWLSPFVGWFLFVSAFARRSPFLIATMGIILLPIVEKIVLPTSFFGAAIWERTFRPPLADLDFGKFLDDDVHFEMTPDLVSIVSAIDIQGFVTSPSLWAGMVVCGLFTTAAIYVRRYRDDS